MKQVIDVVFAMVALVCIAALATLFESAILAGVGGFLLGVYLLHKE